MENLKELTNLYSLQKTLRFELIPQGKTLENIENNRIRENDGVRAQDYKKIKKLIDEYHKRHIEIRFRDFSLDGEDLKKFKKLYEKDRNDEEEKELKKLKENFRKQIASRLYDGRLFSKEFINEDLPQYLQNRKEDLEIVEKFRGFTTYFTGFFENRKNIYSNEEIPTAIAYRLIHENLPKFINNLEVFDKIKDKNSYITENFNDCLKGLGYDITIDEFFTLDRFNKTFTQEQIEEYNAVIGGKLNEYVNLYNQQQNERNLKLPLFKPLYKQILSDRGQRSWLPEQFDDDKQMANAILKLYKDDISPIIGKVTSLLSDIANYDLSKIYITNDSSLTTISQRVVGFYYAYTDAIKEKLKAENPKTNRQSETKYTEKINKIFNNIKSFSIAELNTIVKDKVNAEDYKGYKTIEDYIKTFGASEKEEDLLKRLEKAYTDAEPILNNIEEKSKNIGQDKDAVEKIKKLLDILKDIQHFAKLLLCSNGEIDIDADFYNKLNDIWANLDKVTPIYNMVRNYLTKKPYSEEKIKLTFDKSTLLNGWDLNKEPDNLSVILHKDDLYYLGIMKTGHNRIFDNNSITNDDDCFEKMEYKLLPGPNKMLPKVFFSKKGKETFKPGEEILKIYENKSFKKGDNFNIGDCRKLIDFYKESINKHTDWRQFNFTFSNTETYNDISQFYKEVEQQGYKITFRKISANYINKLVEENKLYLFKIWNKDFSEHSKGTPNIHTLYWEQLFDPENIKNVIYKLNGGAEMFFRKKSISEQDVIKHVANNPVKNKNTNNSKKESKFDYDLIKNKRYTMDKFHFHVPITINFKAQGQNDINPIVNDMIRYNKIEHIIGIDRGERNLLYLSIIDLKGNIVEQMSLNEIINEYNGNTYKTDYHHLLDKKEEEREQARLSWNTIENIKELKDGYMSQVVHIIAQKMVEKKAIVVLEDLNLGFMRSRQKIEKQVYQKFEKKLIDKLNYYVDKKKSCDEIGGLHKALQLTNEFESFEKLGKQSGFLFYVPAAYTSKIDPVTGFVNMFDTSYCSVQESQDFFSKFDTIRYNAKDDLFEFAFDYNNFTTKAKGTKTQWTLCSFGQRIEIFRNKEKNNEWDNKKININDEFKQLFKDFNINIYDNLEQEIQKQTSAEFFKRIMHLVKLLLQIRNSITGSTEKNDDYIISPVADENGKFFDSRNVNNNVNLPQDADANGAYNIARKGLWVVRQIQNSKNEDKINLAISNKEWLNFVQQKPYLND